MAVTPRVEVECHSRGRPPCRPARNLCPARKCDFAVLVSLEIAGLTKIRTGRRGGRPRFPTPDLWQHGRMNLPARFAWRSALRRACFVFLLAIVPSVPGSVRAAQASPPGAGCGRSRGAVVVTVAPGGGGGRAGLQAGDVVCSWIFEPGRTDALLPRKGMIDLPFDLDEVELELAPQGLVRLAIRRSGKPLELEMSRADWRLETRPWLAPADLAGWKEAKRLADSEGDAGPVESIARLRRLAAAALRQGNRRLTAWFDLAAARQAQGAGRFDDASAAAAAAESEGTRGKDFIVVAKGARLQARIFAQKRDSAGQERALLRALDARRKVVPDGLGIAGLLNDLGSAAGRRGDLVASEAFLKEALAIGLRLAPEGMDVASSLNNLGVARELRGDLASAADLDARALEIKEKLVPESLALERSVSNLGNVLFRRGDFEEAERLHRRSLAMLEKLAPVSLAIAGTWQNLGILLRSRGDLGGAEEFHRRALALQEELAPGTLDVAYSLTNVAGIAEARGDFDLAEELYRRALAIEEVLSPGSLDVALTLNNLGVVAGDRGDSEGATKLYEAALVIRERQAPDSLEVSITLDNLGQVAGGNGELERAANLHTRALAIAERVAPQGIDRAASLEALGNVYFATGDLAAAEKRHQDAATLLHRLGPGTLAEADSLHSLSRVHLRQGRVGEGRDELCEALSSLESARVRFGGTDDSRSGVFARYADWYREAIDLDSELGHVAPAFFWLERSRARGLLALLGERDLVLSKDADPNLLRERKLVDADYDAAQSKRAELTADDAEGLAAADTELAAIRRKRDDAARRLRVASPRLASLVLPEPFDLEEARRHLDPGTLLLAYSLGESGGRLFAIDGDGGAREVFRLDAPRRSLETQVARFRLSIRRLAEDPSDLGRENVRTLALSLSRRILGPAARRIAKAARILIVPDGPLHLLPWAALADPSSTGFRWLVETKPVHSIVSMTVYAELTRLRTERPGERTTVAFGDPVYPEGAAGRFRSRLILDPLPGTRAEVEAIRSLAPASTIARLGADATEENAMEVGPGASVLHFACHGIIDERFPLDSALALTLSRDPPAAGAGRQAGNGFLQAWEIFERMRIDADLVTLSACETGTGRSLEGEGLVGLVRAFEYAGAKSVLATLWGVSDESTAILMEDFYRRWRGGLPKDEALRQAQAALLNGPYPDPFHWAGFELIGDWR